MQMTTQNTQPKQQIEDTAPDWLLCDLEYIRDFLIQESAYDEADEVAAIIEQAEKEAQLG